MMEKRQFRIKKRFGILIFILLIIAIILYIIAFRSSLFDVKK